MKMISELLIHVPEEYRTEIKTSGDTIVLDNSTETVSNTVRYGTVLETPAMFKSNIRKGDKIYFHQIL